MKADSFNPYFAGDSSGSVDAPASIRLSLSFNPYFAGDSSGSLYGFGGFNP